MVAPTEVKNKETDGSHSGEHHFQFSEKAWHEHVLDFFSYLRLEAPAFATVTISLWGITEVLMAITENRIPVREFAGPVLLIAFIVTSHRAFLRYRSSVPEALENESATAQQIYRKQKCGWQFRLANQMLYERIASIEAALARIASGAEFIGPTRLPIRRYVAWLEDRPEALRRLVESVAIQCTVELPKAITRTASENHLFELRLGIYELARLYAYTERFERECHEVIPPEGLENVHAMTYGWSNPTREGVGELLNILGNLADIDKGALKAGTVRPGPFEIVFKGPDNVDEFCKELDLLDLPSIIGSYEM